jgi:hypothetical protein
MTAALPDWLAEAQGGARISARVTPRAGKNEFGGERAGCLQVRVTAAPEDGKANAAACKLIAKRLRIGTTAVQVVAGATSRNKTFEVQGVSAEEVRDALAS